MRLSWMDLGGNEGSIHGQNRSQLGHARHDHGGAFDRQLVRSAQADLNDVAANERGLTALCAVPGSDVLLRGDLHVGVEHGELPLAHLILQRLLLTVGHGENRQLVQRSLHQRPGSALAWAHSKRRDTGVSDERRDTGGSDEG